MGSLTNGGSKWSPNIWGPNISSSGLGRGSGSLLPSSEVDSWNPKSSTPYTDSSQPRRGSAFPPLKQPYPGQTLTGDGYINGFGDNARTKAGQDAANASSFKWQSRPGKPLNNISSNDQKFANNSRGLNSLNTSGAGPGNFGYSADSWADDDSMFSPLDSRHNSSARQIQSPMHGPSPVNGFPNSTFGTYRNGTNLNGSPWQKAGPATLSNRSNSVGNGLHLSSNQASKSASVPSDTSNLDPTFLASFQRMGTSGSDASQEAYRRHNLALQGSIDPRNISMRPQPSQQNHLKDMVYGTNAFESRKSNDVLGSSNTGLRPAFTDSFDRSQALSSGDSDFSPTYTTDMLRTASSDSQRSNTLARAGIQNPFRQNGRVPPQYLVGSDSLMPHDRHAFAALQQQEDSIQYQYQQWCAMQQQMRQQMQDPFAYTLPFEPAYSAYLPMPHFQDHRMTSFGHFRHMPDNALEPGVSLRSELLEEFKSNAGSKGSKKYDLRVS